MKRSGPPKRTTPLQAHTELRQSAELPRSTPLPRTSPPLRSVPAGGSRTPKRKSRPGLDRDLDKLVRARDEGCVGCGITDVRLEVHHRRRKGMGGSKLLDHPANLLCLCGWGNHTGCHGWAHTWSATHAAVAGLTVPEGEAPASWPVVYAPALGGGLWLLDDEGDRRRVE